MMKKFNEILYTKDQTDSEIQFLKKYYCTLNTFLHCKKNKNKNDNDNVNK